MLWSCGSAGVMLNPPETQSFWKEPVPGTLTRRCRRHFAFGQLRLRGAATLAGILLLLREGWGRKEIIALIGGGGRGSWREAGCQSSAKSR